MTIDRRKYLYRIKRLEIKSWLKYLMIEGKHVVDYVLGELMSGTDITINNTVEKKFYKFDIKGNSVQDGTPAPDNEVPIYSAGDNGTISEKIVNKNLANWEYGELNYSTGAETDSTTRLRTKNYIILENNSKISYITNTTNALGIRLYEKDGTFIGSYLFNASNKYTNNLGKTVYARFRVALETGETLENAEIQIEYGDPTTYVAHQEQTYTIPVQQPMRSIGDVRDEFPEGENKERHNLISVAFDGSDDESWSNQFGASLFGINLTNKKINASSLSLCNYFIFHNVQSGLNNNLAHGEFSIQIGTTDTLYIKNTDFTTTADFKNWLKTHNVEVIYQLATPQDLPCTSEQIAILENLPKSYNEQTNIYSLDVTPAYIEVQAYVKKEEVIEND